MVDNNKIKRVLESLEDVSNTIEDEIEKEMTSKIKESGLIQNGMIKLSDCSPYLISGSKEFTVRLIASVLNALLDEENP